MTIELPPPNVLDRLLRLLGKKRGIARSLEIASDGPYMVKRAKRESFLGALFRSKKKNVPKPLIKNTAVRASETESRTESVRHLVLAVTKRCTREASREQSPGSASENTAQLN
ncbi:MAG: hypothetical protein V1736_02180 [Pseudomonadota bacterium]